MAVRGLACGHLMPAPHLGAMSGPHKQRGRSGSQPRTPARTPSRELDGVPDMALFSSLPSLHAPGPRSKVTAYSPQSNCRLPEGEEHTAKPVCESPTGRAKREASGGLLPGRPKTEQAVAAELGSRSRVRHRAPLLGSTWTSEQPVSGFLPPGPTWHPRLAPTETKDQHWLWNSAPRHPSTGNNGKSNGRWHFHPHPFPSTHHGGRVAKCGKRGHPSQPRCP